MSRKRIFLLASVGLGQEYGLGTYSENLADEALKYGSRLELIIIKIRFCNDLKPVEIDSQGNVTRLVVPVLGKEEDFWDEPVYSKGFLSWINNKFSLKSNDIFHFNSFSALDIAFLLKNEFGVRVVYTIHFSTWKSYFENEEVFNLSWSEASDLERRKWHYIDVEYQMIKIADSVICLSKETMRIMSEIFRIDPTKLFYLSNFLQKEILRVDNLFLNQLNPKGKIIMYCGRIDGDKGIMELLEACNNLFFKIRDCTLLLVGGGDISQFLGRFPNLWGRLIYTGYIKEKKFLDKMFSITDIQVLISRHEQSSFTLLEGLRSKNAMIISDIPAFEDIEESICMKITDGEFSLRIKQLEEKLSTLLESEDLIEELGSKGYHYFIENFTADKNFPILCRNAYEIFDLVN